MCLLVVTILASWSQEVAVSNIVAVMANIFLTEFIKKNI